MQNTFQNNKPEALDSKEGEVQYQSLDTNKAGGLLEKVAEEGNVVTKKRKKVVQQPNTA